MNLPSRFTTLFFAFALFMLAACGGETETPTAGGDILVRQQRPTFTATPVLADPNAPLVTPTPPAEAVNNAGNNTTEVAPTSQPANSGDKPMLVISEELVNARGGPGTDFPLIERVERGQQFEIIGKNADASWWQICCVNNQQVWIIATYADTDGAVDGVPVVNNVQVVQAAATATTQPVAANPQPTRAAAQPTTAPAATQAPAPTQAPTQAPAPAAPAQEFSLQSQEQFPENNVVRIFMFAYSGAEALPGYSVRVAKNGVELTVSAAPSNGPQPSLTWPIADGRQRLQNFKLEFPGEAPGGTWEVQIVKDGAVVGPVATFKLVDGDPNREMYVRYQKNK